MNLQKKDSIRINGTTFNRKGVNDMTADEFVAMFMPMAHVFPSLDGEKRRKRLSDIYVDITGRKPPPAEKEEKSKQE